ncbi:AraC family transcriptional regulator [Halobacillus litoralis]|uniref:AraC family transcriptional regulator n=1 Tax=Halobacillus litoralis TaxID=45668 RepID=UPI00249398D4|nr:AraC family transcriptional regulator [Halobacillus litoralis]
MEMRLEMEGSGVLMFDLQEGEADESHTHDYFQLSVPLSGDLMTYHNSKKRKLEFEESLLVPPGDSHQHEAVHARKKIMLISFNEEIISEAYRTYTGFELDSIDFSPVQSNSQLLLNKAMSLFQIASYEGMEAVLAREGELASVLLDQMRGSHSEHWEKSGKKRPYSSEPSIKAIKDYILERYQDDVTLDHLAVHLNISKYHLHRSFTNAVGMTPREFLHHVRLRKAACLLKGKDMEITEVAFKVGFQSISTFNRSFKKFYGKTPTQFLKEFGC